MLHETKEKRAARTAITTKPVRIVPPNSLSCQFGLFLLSTAPLPVSRTGPERNSSRSSAQKKAANGHNTLIAPVRAGELDDLFSQAVKIGTSANVKLPKHHQSRVPGLSPPALLSLQGSSGRSRKETLGIG
jgi:hypothetical protein